MEYPEERWGSTKIFLAPRRATRGHTRRWVVRLQQVHVRRAKTLYPDQQDEPRTPATAQLGERENDLLLWDAGRLRKSTTTAVRDDGGGSSSLPGAASGGGGRKGSDDSNVIRGVDISPQSSSTATPGSATGVEAGDFFTPSEPFFAGALAGVEALSAKSVEFSLV